MLLDYPYASYLIYAYIPPMHEFLKRGGVYMLGAEPPELASSDHVSCRDGVDIIIKRDGYMGG